MPENAGISVSQKLFAPRVGLAYRLDDKTVIRAGYGLNFDPIPFSRPLRGWYPLVINFAYTAPNGFGWATHASSRVFRTRLGRTFRAGVVPLPGDVSERSPWGGIHRGYVQSLELHDRAQTAAGPRDVHRLCGLALGAPAGRLRHQRRLPRFRHRRAAVCRAFGRTIPTNMWDGYLSSNYHSLQVAVNRSFAKGLMIKGAYTYSKAIDYTDDDGWASVGWNWAPVFQRNRATAGFDRTHVFQVGWVYELPFGKGKIAGQVRRRRSGPRRLAGERRDVRLYRHAVHCECSGLLAERSEQHANRQPDQHDGQLASAMPDRANSTTTPRLSPP